MGFTALWWWIDRWRKSTAYMDMTLEEQGAYRNLLDEAALRGGPLPNDERVLGKACGDAQKWRKVRAVVMARFTLTPDGWRNGTLDEVLRESLRRSEKQRRYRNNRGNGMSNVVGNTAGNNMRPPDPDPDPDLKEKKEDARARVSLSSPLNGTTDQALADRAARFIERYTAIYPQHRHGARYVVNPHRDYVAAVALCETWTDDARLEKLAVCFLTTDHQFAASGSRTITQFKGLASWADGELAKWEKGV